MDGGEIPEDAWENVTRSEDRQLCQWVLEDAAKIAWRSIVLLCQSILEECGCGHGFYWEGPDMNGLGQPCNPPVVSNYIAKNNYILIIEV